MRLNVPTLLTIGRVAIIPLMLLLLAFDHPQFRHCAAILFVIAAITDWLDGWLARRWNQTSRFGEFLDPVADKLLVAVALVMLLRADPGLWMAGLVAIIIGREITISALREWLAEIGQRKRVAVGLLGKLKTTAQMVAISAMLWQTPIRGVSCYTVGYYALFFAAALTLWSMIGYLRAAWPAMRDN
jgi:CDP-diacylglycerol--glycerol-3-phosphate 3-phosphatidyltransferase